MRYCGIFKEIAKTFRRGSSIVILEIGVSFTARSTRSFLGGLKMRAVSGKLYSIDIIDNELRVRKKVRGLDDNWVFIHGDSKQIAWDKPIDVLFIDGNHTYDAVKADYSKYEPFVNKWGLILLHDATTPNREFGVNRLYHEIKYPKVVLNFDTKGLAIISKMI